MTCSDDPCGCEHAHGAGTRMGRSGYCGQLVRCHMGVALIAPQEYSAVGRWAGVTVPPDGWVGPVRVTAPEVLPLVQVNRPQATPRISTVASPAPYSPLSDRTTSVHACGCPSHAP